MSEEAGAPPVPAGAAVNRDIKPAYESQERNRHKRYKDKIKRFLKKFVDSQETSGRRELCALEAVTGTGPETGPAEARPPSARSSLTPRPSAQQEARGSAICQERALRLVLLPVHPGRSPVPGSHPRSSLTHLSPQHLPPGLGRSALSRGWRGHPGASVLCVVSYAEHSSIGDPELPGSCFVRNSGDSE